MERTECSDAEVHKGDTTLEGCFNICKGSTSYMIWGRTEPINRCITSELCSCWCEGPFKYGECPDIAYNGTDLYEIHPALQPE